MATLQIDCGDLLFALGSHDTENYLDLKTGVVVPIFADLLDGYKEGGLVRSYGNRYYHKPIIAGKIQRPKAMTVEWFQYAQSLTDRPVG